MYCLNYCPFYRREAEARSWKNCDLNSSSLASEYRGTRNPAPIQLPTPQLHPLDSQAAGGKSWGRRKGFLLRHYTLAAVTRFPRPPENGRDTTCLISTETLSVKFLRLNQCRPQNQYSLRPHAWAKVNREEGLEAAPKLAPREREDNANGVASSFLSAMEMEHSRKFYSCERFERAPRPPPPRPHSSSYVKYFLFGRQSKTRLMVGLVTPIYRVPWPLMKILNRVLSL